MGTRTQTGTLSVASTASRAATRLATSAVRSATSAVWTRADAVRVRFARSARAKASGRASGPEVRAVARASTSVTFSSAKESQGATSTGRWASSDTV